MDERWTPENIRHSLGAQASFGNKRPTVNFAPGLPEEHFATLMVSLENEQRQLKADIPALEDSLNATADKADDLQKFIQRARQVTRLTELTPEIVHEFIDKIVVPKPEKIDGKRHQRVDIYYSTIGLWTAPEPETLEQAKAKGYRDYYVRSYDDYKLYVDGFESEDAARYYVSQQIDCVLIE